MLKRLSLVILLAIAPAMSKAAVVTVGPVSSYAVLTNAANGNRYIQLSLGTNGTLEVVPFAPDVVRVRFHFVGLYEREEPAIAKTASNWPAFAMSITNLGGTNLVLQTDQLKVDIVLSNKFQVHFRDPAGYPLLQDFQVEYDPAYFQIDDTNAYRQVAWPSGSTSVSNLPSAFKVKAIKVMPADEAYFGGGEFATALNRRGASLQYWNQGTFGWEESRNPMYLSLPFYYGVRPEDTNRPAFAYGVFFNNPARPLIKFNSGFGDTYSFEAGDDQLDYFFFGGGTNHAPAAVLDRYSELTGRPTMLPKWAYGYHQSRHSYSTQSNLQAIAQGLRDHDFPCDALYLDIGTQSNNHQLTFNPGFTNVAGAISFCTNLGMRLVPLVEPFLLTNDPLYAEAFTNLYFLKNNDLSIHLHTNFLQQGLSWFDFSIAQTRDWWTGRLTNYFGQYPFESMWNDLNEPEENDMPLDALFYLDGRYGGGGVTGDTRKWAAVNRNTFALLQTAVSYGAQRAAFPNRRPFVLTRSGWPGIARYAVGWSGDNVSSYEHLRHNIRLGTSVMISGQPNFGHDIGGFTGDVSDDLFTRWLAMSILQPFCRNHTFSANREPWLFPDANVLMNRRLIKFRYEMMPYLYTIGADAATHGMPMNRPTFFEFLGDVNTYSQNDYDFLVGQNLLAAPVYASNAVSRSVYLPFGANWFSWQYDAFHLGGQTISEPASLGTLPLFVREGTIIPMGPAMSHVDEFLPDHLDIHAWPQASGDFTLYEDDGVSTNCLAGRFARTRFTSASSGNYFLMTAHAREGSYDPGARSFYFVVHALSNAVAVAKNGLPMLRRANRAELESEGEGWSYDFKKRQLVVRVTDTALQQDLAVNLGTPSPANTNSFASSFAHVSVSGAFNAWNDCERNLTLVSPFTWAGVFNLGTLTNIAFRFVGNDSASVTNWGDTGQTNGTLPLLNVADPAGSNIVISGVSTGRLTFTFCETNLRYSVVAAQSADSDGDGASDLWESYYGLDATDASDAARDADGDGLSNSNEYRLGGSPVRDDSDGDFVPDGSEFIAGTEVTNAASYLALTSQVLNPTNSGTVMSWSGALGRVYRVEFATNVADWYALPGYSNITGAGVLSAADTNAAVTRTYRVGVSLP